MAETAPLTSAHAHVRKAIDEQHQVRWSQAAVEHQSASTDFARAARGTSDGEALRVLKLLEEQHQKLARIVKSYDSPPQPEVATEDAKSEERSVATSPTLPATSSDQTGTTKAKPATSALAAARIGSAVRDSSPSLARDIASRRGIPQPGRNPSTAAAQTKARPLSPESQRRPRAGANSRIPSSVVDSQHNLQQAKRTNRSEQDDGFARFYSNITSGTMSKLSSALAYAGLPLTAEEPSHSPRPDKRTVSAVNEPNVKEIFSQAALDAVEDEHRQRGTLGHGFGPAESFYVVQKGGGTYSYADIARAQQNHQLSGIDEEDDEAFVDANEVPGPPSPRRSRASSQSLRNPFGNPQTYEELELENTTLKQTLEHIANRLAAFETHAQDASMAALTQSMVGLRPPSGEAATAAAQERLRQLERQVAEQAEERQKLEVMASKQKDMLRKYQAKWEEVKKSAREKERAKKEREKEKAERSMQEPAAEDDTKSG